jgi:hypothetical protein
MTDLPPSRQATYAALVLERYSRADGKYENAVRRALAEFIDRLDHYAIKEAG